jgi:MFS family permease
MQIRTGIPNTNELTWMQKRTIPRGAAFVVVAATFFAFLAAAAAPSPLFVIYQARWHFPSGLLSVAFAVYAFALIVALLIIGSLSDHVGRRPVILGAIGLEFIGMTLLLVAPNIGVVILGRVIQGIATGAATGAMSAALTELAPEGRKRLGTVIGGLIPAAGLAVGALATGFIVQFTTMPIVIIFVALDVIFYLGLMLVLFSPESGTVRPGAIRSLIPHMAIPVAARKEFVAYVFVIIADWMTAGFFLGLVAEIMRDIFHLQSGLINGASIAVLCGVGTISIFATRNVAARTVVMSGAVALAAGIILTVASLTSGSLVLFAIGTIVSGFGFGTVFAGGIRQLAPLSRPEERGELFSAIYLVSYLAFGLPAVIAGVLAGVLPLLSIVIVYGAITAVCAVIGLFVQLRLRRADAANAHKTNTATAPFLP